MVCTDRFGPIIMVKFTSVIIFAVNTSEKMYNLDTHVIFFTTI